MVTKKSNLLGSLLEGVREDLEKRRARVPLSELKARLREAPPPRDFLGALRAPPPSGASLHVIAELKKASPSRGLIASRYEPEKKALLYEEGGASAISVLTERRGFRGELGHLTRVRERVSLPLLQKDFTVEPYQVYEGRLFGADAVLLIAAILGDRELGELLALSRELGMEALLEVHTEEELSRALGTSTLIIGINNRDLKTFKTNPGMTLKLAGKIPPERRAALTLVAESGITSPSQVEAISGAGVRAILVGETLMCADDPREKIRELVGLA